MLEQNNPYTHDSVADLSTELENMVVYEDASRGQRFANLLVDIICAYGFSFILIIIVGLVYPPFLDYFQQENPGVRLLDRLMTTLLIALYYILIEGLTGGRSVGKFVTGTRALTIDDEPINWQIAFKRNICRIVPFEVLSGFGTPWHDSWSHTKVVKVKR